MSDISSLRPVSEWARISNVSYSKAIRIRKNFDLGIQIPPHTWLLTEDEWKKILKNM